MSDETNLTDTELPVWSNASLCERWNVVNWVLYPSLHRSHLSFPAPPNHGGGEKKSVDCQIPINARMFGSRLYEDGADR
jgi:hypothetical protein